MGKRTAEHIAKAMEPSRSKETVARWARGETVPSALDIAPLAAALGVKAMLLIEPPAVPVYPLGDYLLDAHPLDEVIEAVDKAAKPSSPSAARSGRSASHQSAEERSPARRSA